MTQPAVDTASQRQRQADRERGKQIGAEIGSQWQRRALAEAGRHTASE